MCGVPATIPATVPMKERTFFLSSRLWMAVSFAIFPVLALAANVPDSTAWWVWPVALFAVCFALGVIAVPAGVGGGVLFVPIVSGFFPFHLDFVRGVGLLVALAS